MKPGIAKVCYVDCLKGYSTFAPRMCYRLCANALAKHKGVWGTKVCKEICPVAAHALHMNPVFCPPPDPPAPAGAPAPAPAAAAALVQHTGQAA